MNIFISEISPLRTKPLEVSLEVLFGGVWNCDMISNMVEIAKEDYLGFWTCDIKYGSY